MLQSYIDAFDNNHSFPIPGPSPEQPILRFEERHLQRSGLINWNNTCCHLSLILAFHRMNLLRYLDPNLIAVGRNVLDWPALILTKMLRALPSPRPFSVQNFLTVWNANGRNPRLVANDDLTITDAIISQLPLTGHNNVPALTKFQVSFACPYCGQREESCEQWNERQWSAVPTLHLQPGSPPTRPETLLNGILQHGQQIRITCPNLYCQLPVDATWKVVKGSYTILYINRDDGNGGIVRTRLRPSTLTTDQGLDILGELVSVIARSGERRNRGHFVSYHQVGSHWFFSDDDHTFRRSPQHPFHRPQGRETVDLLCYYNNV